MSMPSKKQPSQPKAAGPAAYDLGEIGRPVALPKIQDSPPWIYIFHPDRWTVLRESGKSEVVPVLVKLPLISGLSNVNQFKNPETGRTTYQVNDAIRAKEARGFFAILPEKAGINYVVPHATESGTAHLTPWETPRPGSGLVRRTPGYVAWLSGLVSSGVIPDIDDVVLDRMIGEFEATAETLQANIDSGKRSYEGTFAQVNQALAAARAKKAEREAA